MELFYIGLTAFGVSILTFFSGFGLGTLLMPVLAMFFPLPLAIAATATVHLLNNIFKAALMGRFADKHILLRFGVPSAFAALLGAFVLQKLSTETSICVYNAFGKEHAITVIKLVIGLLMIVFALFESIPRLQEIRFTNRFLPLGGLLSGFFGGLSGHQGALRTAFLMRVGLQKQQFIGTLVIIAVMVDVSRLFVYGNTFLPKLFLHSGNTHLQTAILTGCICAISGTFIGKKLFEKTTLKLLQSIITVMLIFFGLLIASGII